MYDFNLYLNRALTEEEEDILFETALDADPVSRPDGTGYLMCTVRDKHLTFAEAVAAAAGTVVSALPGVWATGLGLDDTVTLGEAARRSGTRTQSSLRQLAEGERGPGGFPTPVVTAQRHKLYSWAQIAAFLRKLGDDVPLADEEAALVDRVLQTRAELRRSGIADPRRLWEPFAIA